VGNKLQLCIWTYTTAEIEILYNSYQEMAIWKSIVTLIYRELLPLGRKIDIFKLIYRYVLAFGRYYILKPCLGSKFSYCSKNRTQTSINSYDIFFMYKLPWYNCNIVECGIKHHKPYPLFTKAYTYLPIYLHFYQNYRFYLIFAG
jgi:hypothetical protein